MRLNRFLAAAGLGSRRNVEELIKEGRVRINGRVVEELATTVGPEDTVKVGNRVVNAQQIVHAVMNKPKGVVCTADDERGRRTIYEFLPEEWPRVFHVGRLDKESEGLLIVTNDGDMALSLTHPKFKVEKEYEVTLDKPFDPAHTAKLLRGFHIIGGRAKMAAVEQEGPNRLRVVLTQGIKRQIRLMLYELGYEVERLVRVRIGPVVLTKFPPGTWRMLNPKEVAELKGEIPAKPRPISDRSAHAREMAALAAAKSAGKRSNPPRDRDEMPRRREPAGGRGRERENEGTKRFSQRNEEGFARKDFRKGQARQAYGESERRPTRAGERPSKSNRPSGRYGDGRDFTERGQSKRRKSSDQDDFRQGRPPREERARDERPEGFRSRRATSARSAEGRAPAPRRDESRDRRSGSGRTGGAGRGEMRPERRGPRSTPRSGKSRS